jgi:hypothetical protein
MAEAKKCAHPNCSCSVTEGEKYCSISCETSEVTPEIDCKCGHPACNEQIAANVKVANARQLFG